MPHETPHHRAAASVMAAIADILPDLLPKALQPDASLAELGATSIDRVEIALAAMEALGLVLRPAELAGVATIGALIARLEAHLPP